VKETLIKAMTIPEAWFRAIYACVHTGHEYLVDKGEFEGQLRRELDMAIINIYQPGIRPLACQSGDIVPTSEKAIQKYFHDYLMNPDFEDEKEAAANEYKYATWIAPRWQKCCDLLANGDGGCNQATISIGESPGLDFAKPPCLRLIDMRVRYGKLHFVVYFRSWDLIAGLPQNLGGLQMLKETCLDYLNSTIWIQNKPLLEDGHIIAVSKGLHIYEHFFKIAEDYAGSKTDLKSIGIHTF